MFVKEEKNVASHFRNITNVAFLTFAGGNTGHYWRWLERIKNVKKKTERRNKNITNVAFLMFAGGHTGHYWRWLERRKKRKKKQKEQIKTSQMLHF